MLDGEDALRFCLKNSITIEQFFIMYLLARNDFNLPDKRSLGKAYINEIGQFTNAGIQDLVNRGFIENFNSPGLFYPELFMLSPGMRMQFASYEMAEQLWDAYPVTFRLGDKGTKFIARAGGDKDELLALYLQKINHSAPKHEKTLHQLARYADMVNRGEVNGYKIGDFIRQEMWDTIAAIGENEKGGDFGKDI